MADKLSTFTDSHDNNFNLIRFVAASMVLVGHSYDLHIDRFHPFAQYSGLSLGIVGVDIFFVISGFLVTRSLLHRKNLIGFFWARFLRIFPALFIAVIFSICVGAYFTTLPLWEFIQHDRIKAFFTSNILLFIDGIKYYLPGVFVDNPRHAVNGSLWTLPWELKMYFMLFILGIFVYIKPPLIAKQKMGYFFLITCIVAILLLFTNRFFPFVNSVHIKPSFRFIALFFSGASLYAFREKIILSHRLFILIIICLSFAIGHAKFYYIVHYLTFWYVILYLAYIPTGFIRNFNKIGDYSYGMYIYAFPVTQSIIALYPKIEGSFVAIYTFIVTLLLSFISWHLIEKRMLKKKNNYQVYLNYIAAKFDAVKRRFNCESQS